MSRIFVLVFAGLLLGPGFALAQTAQSSDGWVSNSVHFQGTCSRHGGVEVWLNEEMEKQANEWCDENPDLCANSHWRGIRGHGNRPADAGGAGSQGPGMGRNLRDEAAARDPLGRASGMGRNLRQEYLDSQGRR